jgi:Na+/proline symporter
MVTAFVLILRALPADVSWLDASVLAGKLGKMNIITTDFDWRDRYNIWTGLIGGTFLALSYFGTDQSQVSRYLSGKSVTQSRIGLLANGLLKVPMQFAILFLGIMVFVYFQFVRPPLFFNSAEVARLNAGEHQTAYRSLDGDFARIHAQKRLKLNGVLDARQRQDASALAAETEELRRLYAREQQLRREAADLVKRTRPGSDGSDTNYIFLSFVIAAMPAGLIGLVMAAILSASMSSTSAELNALASTTVVDIYKRVLRPGRSDDHYLKAAKLATLFWGIYAIGFALFAERLGSLIEAVNILGSLFYGTILGIFLIAFYFKKIGGTATFISALISEALVLLCFFFTAIPYLWYNVIACLVLVGLAALLQGMIFKRRLTHSSAQ